MNSTQPHITRSLRPSRLDSRPAPAPLPEQGGVLQAWSRFWFNPVEPVSLHIVRMVAGILFLVWLLPLSGNMVEFYSLQGWFDQKAYENLAKMQAQAELDRTMNAPQIPSTWSLVFLCKNTTQLKLLYWGSIAAIALFTLGVATRITSILTWLAVASFTANPLIMTASDVILLMLSLYLMVGYFLLGQWSSRLGWVERIIGPFSTLFLGWSKEAKLPASHSAGFALRLLQIHFAILMVGIGLHKLQMSEWWSGVIYWFPLHGAFSTSLEEAKEHVKDRETYLGFLSFAAYVTLAWQIGFPLFAWAKRLRLLLIGGGIIAWLGAALIFKLPTLGPTLFLCCLSFVTTEEWRGLVNLFARIPGLQWMSSLIPVDKDEMRGMSHSEDAITVA